MEASPRLQTASLVAPDTTGTIHMLDHVAQVAEQFAQQPGLVTEPSFVWTPIKTISFLNYSVNGAAHPDEDYFASRIQRDLLGIVPLFWL